MNPFEQHGAFSWAELITTNPEAAAEFYKSVFGWEIEKMDMPTGPYTVVKAGGQPIGGIMSKTPEMPEHMPPMWGSYVTVTDVDEVAAKVAASGGQVIAPPFDVPTVGRLAVLQDPQGATISAITYAEQTQDEEEAQEAEAQ